MDNPEGLTTFEPSLQRLTIELIGFESVAQFVNPLAFYVNQIVDDTWQYEKGAKIGFDNSSFRYLNGVEVEAIGDSVIFRQNGSPLGPKAVLCPEVAKRYAEAIDIRDWFAVDIDFNAQIAFGDELITLPFTENLAVHDLSPRFGVDAVYSYEGRTVQTDLRQPVDLNPGYLICFGSVHRPIDSLGSDAKAALRSVIENWQADWEEVALVTKRLFQSVFQLEVPDGN